MSKERVFEGKDLGEALRAASKALDVPEPDLHYEMIEQGRRGVFGFGAKSVRIRIMPPVAPLPDEPISVEGPPPPRGSREAAAPRARPQPAERRPSPAERERPEKRRRRSRRGPRRSAPQEDRGPVVNVPPEVAAQVGEMVGNILRLMTLDLAVHAESRDGGVTVHLEGPDERLLKKQKSSEGLQALQFVLNRMIRRQWPTANRIRVVISGERGERDDELIEMIREVAQQVSRTGQTKKMHPMNAYERRLVHLTVREFSGLTSTSDGEGAMKCVRIAKVQNQL